MRTLIFTLMLISAVRLVGCGGDESEQTRSDEPIYQNTSENKATSPEARKIAIESYEAAIETWGDRYEELKSQVTALPEPAQKTLQAPMNELEQSINDVKEQFDRMSNSGDEDFSKASKELEQAMDKTRELYGNIIGTFE